jgi:hypothetical protein
LQTLSEGVEQPTLKEHHERVTDLCRQAEASGSA